MKLSELKMICESHNIDFGKVTPEVEAGVKKLYSKLKSIGVDFRNRRMEDDIYVDSVYGDKTQADLTFAGENWDVYTSRPGEEDDDHPTPNSKFKPLIQKAETAAKEVFKDSKISVRGGEKYSIYVSVRLPISKIFKNELKLEP